MFEYQLTFGNGTPTNARSETDRRVYLRPFAATDLAALKGLGFGFGGSYGRRQGAPAVPLTGTLRTLGGRPYFATLADAANPAAGTVFAKGEVVRLVPQLAYTAGPVSLYGEYIRLTEELNKAPSAAPSRISSSSFTYSGRDYYEEWSRRMGRSAQAPRAERAPVRRLPLAAAHGAE